MIKFTPFARRHRSSTIGSLSSVEGVQLISASVNSHWLESSESMAKEGSWSAGASCLRGGEFLAECCGGEGTAGGIDEEAVVMVL